MEVTNTRRIVLLGKTETGKSSLANTIFGEATFQIRSFSDSNESFSQSKTKTVDGKSLTLIDTPGFFDPSRSGILKREILRCIAECAPGPHAFLIVLKVEKFTEHEKAVITQLCKHFSEDVFKYAAVVFTRGDQLLEGMKIEDFVTQSEDLTDLVKKCGNRCHVIDNKYWKNNQEDDYRNNKFQVAALLNSIEKIVTENNGGYYTNEMIQRVEREIQKEEKCIRKLSENLSQEEIRKQAKSNIIKKQVEKEQKARLKYFVGLAVFAGVLATISALLKSNKSWEGINTLSSVVEQIPEKIPEMIPEMIPIQPKPVPVPLPVPCEYEVVMGFEAIWNKLHALYERTFDPWNLFE